MYIINNGHSEQFPAIDLLIDFMFDFMPGMLALKRRVEWMNEWCIYVALFVYCCTPKALYNHVGGLSSTTTSVQHPLWIWRLPQDNGPVRSPHTSYSGEERESYSQSSGWGLLRGHDWQGPWGNLARTPGLHPTLTKCHGIINDQRESGPRFNVSSERR